MRRAITLIPVVMLCASCAGLRVEQISFNHDSSSWTGDGLNIRRNFASAVSVPEWVSGETAPVDSPAAFVGDRAVTVKARFKARYDGTYKCYTTGGPFQLKPATVTIQGGVSNPSWVTFESTRIPQDVKRTDTQWQWRRKLWVIFSQAMNKSFHRFYVVKDVPKAPWTQAPFPDTQNPWTEALDVACNWASGETTADGITTKLTQSVNNGPYAYDQSSGASFYSTYSPRRYNMTAFLDRINGGWGNGGVLNCTDCGMSVTTFGNLLGTELWSSRMHSGGLGSFTLNQIVAVGSSSFACPGWGCSFSYHEVAWTGNALASDRMYDACLKVDGDSDPVNAPRTALLPINMVFDDPGGLDYHERLVPPSSIGKCLAQPTTKIRAPVF
jgi:hypothetical protein